MFTVGHVIPAWDNEYDFINNFEPTRSFIGLTTTYFEDVDRGIGRLGVIYFKCGNWTPHVPEPEPEVLPEPDPIPITPDKGDSDQGDDETISEPTDESDGKTNNDGKNQNSISTDEEESGEGFEPIVVPLNPDEK